jgi:4-diphosphocytidyl-2-C-methyl-D-erythritol kinase
MPDPAELIVRAPAKINLHLGVGAPREDGFHPLATVYEAVGLYDDVTVRPADDWQVAVRAADHVDATAVPLAGDNIVDRAAQALADHHGLTPTGHAHIEKFIPVAGGLAGGSADAAAALVALDRLWSLHTPDSTLLRLAAGLGSDVPFALLGDVAYGGGRGELVMPVPNQLSTWWVVVPSATGLSTPEVYRHFDALFPDAPAEPERPHELLAAVATADVGLLANTLHNDLQPAAFDLRPELELLVARGESEGALRGLVSGSGPTCVFLCGSVESARELATALRDQPVVLLANGPVPGAHVVSYA